MIDFHSHCLPAMDDGAADVTEATAMLSESLAQGVHTIIATPHFYRSEEKISTFLQRRAESMARLCDSVPQDMTVRLGAEVLLQRGISRLDLRPLCMEGTNRILIELPFVSPSAWVYEELENIAYGQRLDVILAHVDRYMPWYSAEKLAPLMELPNMVIQLNGEAFLDKAVFRALRRWLPSVNDMVLGSDMHHIATRRPNLAQAQVQLHRNRVGRRWLANVRQTEESVFLPPQNNLLLEGFF
jgi:protein-tyrosine phosphatase